LLNITTYFFTGYTLRSTSEKCYNSTIQISYGLSETGSASLVVYDLSGREVVTLIDSELTTGTHNLSWKADGMPTGVYLARLEQGGKVATMKLLLVK